MSLFAAYLAEIVLLTYRQYSQGYVAQAPLAMPLPSVYVYPTIGFGALALVPGEGQRLAGLVGWGFVIATFLRVFDPSPTAGVKAPGGGKAATGGPATNAGAAAGGTSSSIPGHPGKGMA